MRDALGFTFVVMVATRDMLLGLLCPGFGDWTLLRPGDYNLDNDPDYVLLYFQYY